MASQIDATKPEAGTPTTASVRANFAAAKSEIEALQQAVANIELTPGPQGPQGDPGPQGPAGADGAPGATGATGPAGPAGADGATGATGPAGPTGPAGADGAQGATGATGATGPQGPAGTAGIAAGKTIQWNAATPHDVCPLCVTVDQGSYTTVTAGHMYAVPFYCRDTRTINALIAYVATAVTGTMQIALCADDTAGGGHKPGTVLLASAAISHATTGFKVATGSNVTLTEGTIYWLVVGCTGAPAIYKVPDGSATAIFGFTPGATYPPLSLDAAYSGDIAASIAAATWIENQARCPWLLYGNR